MEELVTESHATESSILRDSHSGDSKVRVCWRFEPNYVPKLQQLNFKDVIVDWCSANLPMLRTFALHTLDNAYNSPTRTPINILLDALAGTPNLE